MVHVDYDCVCACVGSLVFAGLAGKEALCGMCYVVLVNRTVVCGGVMCVAADFSNLIGPLVVVCDLID